MHTCYALAATTDRPALLLRAEPAEHPDPHRGRPQDPPRLHRDAGHKLVSADYSQIELRLLAEIADIAGAASNAFRDGLDIHAMTASEMFGVPVKGMPGEVRRRAKAINFGIIYGISAFGLANQLGIAREEAGAYIKKYFERFPGIRDYMEETKAFAKKNGYVLTLFGRKCHYPDIAASNAVDPRLQRARRDQRAAAGHRRRHHPPRHDAHGRGARQEASSTRRCCCRCTTSSSSRCRTDEVEKTLPVVKKVMEDAPLPALSLSVPLQVDARAADNWDEAH